MTCGATKPVAGAAPLVCNLEAGHDGPHGVRQFPTTAPYVTWRAAFARQRLANHLRNRLRGAR